MDGYVTIKTKLDTKSFENQIREVEDELKNIDYELSHKKELKLDSRTIREYQVRAEKLNNQLTELNKKQRQLEQADLSNINKNLDKTGSKIGTIIKKVGRWAIAVFGVRTAYSAIRSAMSTLSQYNEDLANKLNYIKLVFASALEPIVLRLVNLVYKLLSYVNYLSKAWFNVDLFARASELSLKNSTSSAKDLKKSLAGFDEMNVVQDTSSSGSSGSTGGFTMPEDVETPKWLEKVKDFGLWVKDNWQLVLVILGGTAILFLALSIAIKGLTANVSGVVALTVALLGLSVFIYSISDLVKSLAEAGMDVKDVGLLLLVVLGSMVALMGAVALLGPAMTAGLLPFAAVMAVVMATLAVMALTLPKILDVCKNFITGIAPSIQKILETIGKIIERIIISLGITLPPIINSLGSLFTKIFGGIKGVIQTVGNVIVNIMNTANKLVKDVLSSILSFINKLGPAINNFVDNAITAVTKLINFMVSGVEYLINTLIVDSINALLKTVKNNKIAELLGVDKKITLLSDVKIRRFKPMKTGGIINMPGKGIPVGNSAIGGEAGREGILPLTDSQAMEKLGESIGKYITINANITNTMNGRVLSRELQKIQSSNNFAMNR